jgi:hypothetical protein
MTESEWLECDDPAPMLEWLREKASDRKLRLFACACCRRIWYLLTDERTRWAVEAAEQYADGSISREALRQADEAGRQAWMDARKRREETQATEMEDQQAAIGAEWQKVWAASVGMGPPRGQEYSPEDLPAISYLAARAMDVDKGGLWVQERSSQSPYLRDIFGNPFHPVSINAAWLTPTVTSLATADYDERALPSGELDAVRLAVLADALEEAGCDSADMLTHLRATGPHVRGCWVVDLLLAKG